MIRSSPFVLLIISIAMLMGDWFSGDIMKNKIDVASLEFTCVKEQNPPLDKEADEWFQQARRIERGEQSGTVPQVLELYEKAVAKSHYKAINNLAHIYIMGDIVKVNRKRAVKLTEQGMKLESPMAYHAMGVYLSQGIGVKQDKTAALAYYRKSADLGNSAGQYAVGDILLGNFRQSPDADKIMPIAIRMLECALEQGYAEAGLRLGYYYSNFDEHKERGLIYFQKAAALGDSSAIYALMTAFEEGKRGVSKDPERAACYDNLWNELEADRKKIFPDIDQRCPLPEWFYTGKKP